MTSNYEKIAIGWTDLTYTIRTGILRNGQKTLINQLNGWTEFGTLTALMGPSGAGKTTLLKCLNGRLRSGMSEESKIYLSSKYKINSCLVGQQEKEFLIMGLTVKQNLIYASKLKNSDYKGLSVDHVTNVENILQELSLSHVMDNKVVNCSGGEQKRLSIGLEMTSMVRPNLLCIDEPTTGLDSEAADMIMKSLKRLSQTYGIAIITSIHQPNSDIVLSFDKLYILCNTGKCVFSGPPVELRQQLITCGVECELQNQIPIEILLKISSIDSNDDIIDCLVNNNNKDKTHVLNAGANDLKYSPNGVNTKTKCFKFIDVWHLLMRTMLYSYISQWTTVFTQFLFYVITALVVTHMYSPGIGKLDGCFAHIYNSNTSCFHTIEEEAVLYQNIKFLFLNSVVIMFIPLSVTALAFPLDVNIFLNEHKNRWYSTGSYFIVKNLIEAFPVIINAIVYSFLSYTLSSQPMDCHRLFEYTLILTLGMLTIQGMGYLIGIVFLTYNQFSIVFAIGLYSVLLNFSNIFIPTKQMLPIFQHFSDFSLPKFTSNSILIAIYGQNRCSTGMTSLVLHKYELKDELFNTYTVYIVVQMIVLRIVAYILLWFKTNRLFDRNIWHRIKCFKVKSIVRQSDGLSMSDRQLRPFSIAMNSDFSHKHEVLSQNSFKEVIKKLCIAWTDLSLTKPKTLFTPEKPILRSLNGYLEFGSMTALLGPSGAGKTSLLKTINGTQDLRISEESKIYLSIYQKIRTCFVSQDVTDHLLYGLTARQAMTFASKLKNPEKDFDHNFNVNALMSELMIGNTADTDVNKCSGGEQKRLVIAMELTSSVKPNLICIDEPTSGLDSSAAQVVIECLKRLSENHNICVITSIHQPNNDILMMFDRLYVLAKGGQCVYAGQPQDLKQHLTVCGIDCTERQLPIEVLIKYSCKGSDDTTVQTLIDRVLEGNESLRNRCSEESKHCENGIKFLSKRFQLKDLMILLSRNLTQTYQYFWKFLVLKFVTLLWFGYSLTLLFSQDIGRPSGCLNLEDDFENCNKTDGQLRDDSLLVENIFYNFSVILLFIFFELVSTTMSFTPDVKLFFNEHRNSWYSTGVYYWSKALIELIPTLITTIAYVFVIDIYGESKYFFNYLIVLTLGVLCIQNVGHIIGIFFSQDIRSGIELSMVYYIILCLVSNYLVPIHELHYTIQWLSNLSVIKVISELILIRFYGLKRCIKGEISSILYFFRLQDSFYYRNFLFLIFQFILLRSLVLIILLIKTNVKFRGKSRLRRLSSNELNKKVKNIYVF